MQYPPGTARDTEQPRTADFAGVRARLCVPANQHAGLCIRTNLSTACTPNKFEYAMHSRYAQCQFSRRPWMEQWDCAE